MGQRLGSYRPREVIRKLLRAGFHRHHQTGSHLYLTSSDGRLVTVAVHARELKRGVLMAILKQARLTPEQFKDL